MRITNEHFPADYAAIDLETTGLDPTSCHVIEIGVTTCVNNAVVTSSILVQGASVPPDVTHLTGITDEMVAQRGISMPDAIDWLLMHTGNLMLVGHNCIKYDAPIIAKLGGSDAYPIDRFRDTMALFKAMRMGYPLRAQDNVHHEWANKVLNERVYGLKTNLTLACQEMGVGLDRAIKHRAGTDAALTQKLFEKLRERYSR